MNLSGGCQCGAVRFRVAGELGRASLCHCRMCQKAFGGPYGALVSANIADLTWTRGTLKRFQSSNRAHRGFCGDCGTPLTFESREDVIDLAIAAFDTPDVIPPAIQLATESALPWAVADLPTAGGEEQPKIEAHYASVVSHQHPDHDT